mgnify:FL=1
MTEEAKPNTEAGNAEENASAGNMKWYTIHVYSSMEKSAYNALVDRISHSEYKDLFGEVLLPTEKVEDIRNGRKVTTERRLYPGYIFIQMIMNDDTWHLVKNTPRVMEFLGGNRPTRIPESDIARIIRMSHSLSMVTVAEGVEKPKPKVLFELGETVRVKEGAFADFNGRVDEVNYDKSRLKVLVSIFGRQTPVDLAFDEVEKV